MYIIYFFSQGLEWYAGGKRCHAVQKGNNLDSATIFAVILPAIGADVEGRACIE